MKRVFLPFGRIAEHVETLPQDVRERTATKAGKGVFDDYIVQTWTNRAAMVQSIRMQERSAASGRGKPAWRAVVALRETEGW